ncbi:MAG: V-type ATP synthase subunit I [Treponema sp.]|jgi:V/A-type H+-transporting ATPase subunit I|nr:V-type ATP synthase subunit I [Treponema sp.]
MKKVSLVVLDAERDEALERLREVGVLHIEKKSASSEALSRLLEKKAQADQALGLLMASGTKKDQKRRKKAGPAGDSGVDGWALVAQARALGEKRKGLQDALVGIARERSRIAKWGSFDPRGLAFLSEHGIPLTLYEIAKKEYPAAVGDTPLILLGSDKNTVYAAVPGGELPGQVPFAPPECSLDELDERAKALQRDLAASDADLAALAQGAGAVVEARAQALSEIEFETARAGMDTLASEGAAPAEHTVAWLSGYVPRDDAGLLKRAAAENHWALLLDDPAPDDAVPTKLKHNRFVRLLNPLTGFLEVTPGYREVDISLWFLIFFTIFFGMIFGDAGYGLLILLGSIAGLCKTARKGPPLILKLAALLGFSNFLWGLLTGSWFGLTLAALPAPLAGVGDALQRLSLPLISGTPRQDSFWEPLLRLLPLDRGLLFGPTSAKIVQQNLMIVCFSLALAQLSIGHIIAFFKNRSLKSLADLGNIAMLFGMYCIILYLIVSNEARRFALFPPAVYIFAGGFALNFLFANYERSAARNAFAAFGKSILESFKNIISVILGIANVFSDIMSYIRLWAVGLAGAAIAETVNSLAGPILGHLAFFILGIVLLLFGHGLNLILNVLSVLVHGVRLNTLEFSGHVGLTWSGQPYRPFSKK